MNTTDTLTLTASEITNLTKHYAKYARTPLPAHTQAVFVLPDCRITVYNSGKVVFQGASATEESALWQKRAKKTKETERTSQVSTYIGCDETGVGDYFMPLVVASAYIDSAIDSAVQALNIKDSKQLNDDYIREIAPTLKKQVPHALYTLPNDKYNQFIDNGYNGHAIKAFVHNKAITKLIDTCRLPADIDIVMDQFASAKNYRNYLKDIEPVYVPTIFETKAENKYLAVAIASIIARAHFLDIRDGKKNQYGVEFPLGAGAKVDAFGLDFYNKFGAETFKDNVKWHFANTKKIIDKIK